MTAVKEHNYAESYEKAKNYDYKGTATSAIEAAKNLDIKQ